MRDFVEGPQEVVQISKGPEHFMVQGDGSSILDLSIIYLLQSACLRSQIINHGREWLTWSSKNQQHEFLRVKILKNSLGASEELPRRLKWLVGFLVAVDSLLSFNKCFRRCNFTRTQRLLRICRPLFASAPGVAK